MIFLSSIFEKLFNVNRSEGKRVAFSWFINFFYRIGFVIGWTIIVGMFVGRYGIIMLPILFVVNAAFSIIGTLLYSTFIERFKKDDIIFFSVAIATFILLLASQFGESHPIVFFALLLAAEAVFLVQLKIVSNGFIETLFTPLESERTFPLIESSETIGGIIAGVLVSLLSNTIATSSFVYFWVTSILFILPCVLYYKIGMRDVERLALEEEKHDAPSGLFERLSDSISQIRHVSFIKGLFFVVVFQWIFANLIEFQYTKAVSENISAAVLGSGSGFEHALVHNLGTLFILFSASALFIQLFVGGRLISSLGIVGSLLLYPVVMLLSVFGLSVQYGFPTAVLAQTNHTITHAIYLNSYHSAYYSIKEHFREHTREFLEGIVRPFGALLGTGMLILAQRFYSGQNLTLVINLVMIVVLFVLFFVIYSLQGRYTKLACHNLLKSDNKIERVEAIEILSQKGHKSGLPVLLSVLNDPKESDYIKIKILHALSELQDFDAIDGIIQMFKERKIEIRFAAVSALLKYQSVKNFFFKHVFHEYRMIEALKDLYGKEKNEEIRSVIVHLLSRLNPVGTFGFLLDALKNTKGLLRADVIIALGRYNDNHVIPYIEPFLHSNSPIEKAASIVALWKYDEYRDDLEFMLDKMFKHNSKNIVRAAVYAVGELKLKSKRKECVKYLDSKDKDLKFCAVLSLAKMGYADSVKAIVDILFGEDQEFSFEMKRALNRLNHEGRKLIDKKVRKLVSSKINMLLLKTKAKSLNHLNTKYLKYLKMLYSLVEENEEVELINELLYAKKYS
jgi:HEAT repeat protein